jgi:hypothetical protein
LARFFPKDDILLKLLSFSIVSPHKNQGKEVRHLKTNSLETTDIFRGAYFLCRGAELSGTHFKNNDRI